MQLKEITEDLKKGRRALDSINELKILQDWQYDNELAKWYIQISIDSNVDGEIPNNSIWYLVADETYPKGTVKIYPDAQDGCKLTFEHQSNNGIIEKNGLWRKGSLCLESQMKSLGRYNDNPEPFNVDWRLWWNVKRAVDWINDANADKLALDGYPFELPQFSDDHWPYCIFSEDDATFFEWENEPNKYGIVELDLYKLYYIIRDFKTSDGTKIRSIDWGDFLSEKFENPSTAMWVMLDKIPVINRWQAPNTLKELITAIEEQKSEGILKLGLMDIIRKIIKENSFIMRDDKQHLLLLGFPIPEKIGGYNSTIYWQAIKLPILSNKEVNGFRNREDYLGFIDKHHILIPDLELEWLKPQNWSIQQITNRGRLPKNIIKMNTVVIGAGTIGSSIAELIVRSGVTNISVIDDDALEIGNLSRHTLTFDQLGHKKSKKTAIRLNQINPHVNAEYIDKKFIYSEEFIEKMNNFDLIIDCTSENFVLDELVKFDFTEDKIFVSISIGIAAENLYMSLQKAKKFKADDFLYMVDPWLDKDVDKYPEIDLPRDGVKCWSPTFPARYEDIMLASSTAIKVIEDFVDSDKKKLNSVYNKSSTNEFIGYRRVESINE